MKVLTKEWMKNFELGALLRIVNANTKRKIPLVFLNGGTENVGEGLRTFKTNLDVSDKENQLSFIMVSDIYDCFWLCECEDDLQASQWSESDTLFFTQYVNMLKTISRLPTEILNLIKDKRLLALGYAEKNVKSAIRKYIGNKYENACQKWEQSNDLSEKTSINLTACKQFKSFPYSNSISHLLQETQIEDFYNNDGEIRLTNDLGEVAVLIDAKTLTEECNPKGTYIRVYELYKNAGGYEIHFLLERRDNNFIQNFYYATYSFKDLILE